MKENSNHNEVSRVSIKFPGVVILVALFGVLFQLWTGMNYGIFRDEFYYLACAQHLAIGYVDHPPFSIFVLSIWTFIFGDSQFSLRIIPSLLFGLLIILSSMLALEMKGSRYSAILTSLAVLSCPQFLGTSNFYSMNSFEVVFWAILFLILLKIINGGSKTLWIWFGIALGIGVMNKFSVGVLAVSMVMAMMFTPLRKDYLNPKFLTGMLLSLLIFSPYVIWNFTNGFPTLEFMSNAANFKNVRFGPVDFFLAQLLNMGPVNAILWIGGFIALLLSKRLRQYRIIAYIYILSFLFFSLQNSKPYYLAGAYPPLISAGCVFISELGKGIIGKVVKIAMPVLVVSSFVIFSPLAVPVLEPETFIEYSNALGIHPEETERHEKGSLPQHFADRFGWKEMADLVAQACDSLTEEEKKYTVIYCGNYGEAGAINYFRKELNLPEAISGHNNYWLWGPGKNEIRTVIILGGEKEDHDEFEEVIEVGRTNNPYCMSYENDLAVFIARKPKFDLRSTWDETKHYN